MWLTPPAELRLGDGWTRRYARRHGVRVVLVFSRADRWVLVEGEPFTACDVADDPALPGLAAALAAGAEIVRYHPHLRCTVRLGERFGKVLSDDRGAALLAGQRELWEHRAELGFAVAEPLGIDEAARTVWLGAVKGREVEPDAVLAERMGRALATLAASGVTPPGAPTPRRSPRATADALAAAVPSLRGEVEELLARIDALHVAAEPRPLRPVHGAPHPTAWLVDGDRLGLIDFDRLALGHPEADVAAFQAGIERDVAAAFARSYGDLDERRLEAYRLERGLAKALRSTYDLRPDANKRATRRLRATAAGK